MTGDLLNKVQQHPSERKVTTIAQCCDRQLVQTCRIEHDFPASITGFAVATAQLHRLKESRRAELPIRIVVPVHAGPWLPIREASKANLHPVLFHQRQMVQQAREGEFGWRVLLRSLLAGQSVGLRKQRLALIIELLQEHAQIRTMGTRIDSNPLILPGGEDASQGTSTMACP